MEASVIDKALKALNTNGVAHEPLPEMAEKLPEHFEEPPELPLKPKTTSKPLPTEPAADVIFEMRPIQADQIDEWWPKVEEGINEIIFRSKGYYTFTSKEVWVFCRRKIAELWCVFLNGDYAGFAILRYDMRDDWTQKPYLLCWIGHSLTPLAKDCFYRDLEVIAKAKKLYEIRQYSTRLGWDRKPPREGWETCELVLRKVLEQEVGQ